RARTDMYGLSAWGRIQAIGTDEVPVRFESVVLTFAEGGHLELQHTHISTGAIVGRENRNGTLILRESVLEDIAWINLRYPEGDSFVERNVFMNAGGINIGPFSGHVTIRNNHFEGWRRAGTI